MKYCVCTYVYMFMCLCEREDIEHIYFNFSVTFITYFQTTRVTGLFNYFHT